MIRTLRQNDLESLHAAFVAAFRRSGIGTRPLQSAAAVAGKPLRILNVDDSDAGVAAFLDANGAKRTVRQLEMIRSLR